MKDLSEIMVTSNGLKLLTGYEISTGMYQKMMTKDRYQQSSDRELANMKFPLSKIIATKGLPKIQSSDKRFDKKERVKLALDKIQQSGISQYLRDKIFNSKPCIRDCDLKGQYSFLKQIITDKQLSELKDKLKLVKEQE